MKFRKIVSFGDSFVWGDELLDPALVDHPHAHPVLMENTAYRERRCFTGVLGEYYRVPTENFGYPGGSLQSTIWTYLWWIEHETVPLDQCLVLVGLTDGNRASFYNPRHVSYANDPPWNRFMHSSWIHSGATTVSEEWREMGRRYMLLTDCDELVRLNFRQAVLFFQGRVGQHAGLFQFKTIHSGVIVSESSVLWPDSSLQSFFRHLTNGRDYLCDMGHPNLQGHEMIAQRLIKEIDHAIMCK